MMKIEKGKFYKDADVKKRGPMAWSAHGKFWHYTESVGIFDPNGKSVGGTDPDLIEEWQDEPADEHAMPSDEDMTNSNLRKTATMLIEATRYEDAISILYILKGENG